MFPIASPRGEVIAFGGRLLAGEGPKYINSPDTLLFRKQENLFAIHKAIPAIKQESAALVCEGYMDALSFHAAGVQYAVAPLGTAFTDKQARLIRRYAERVYFAFDADPPGQKAAEKACIVAAATGLEAKVVILPGGKDASEILEKEGEGSLQKVRDLAINGDEFLVRRARSLFDPAGIEGKSKAASSLFPYIDALDTEVKRDAFMDLASRELRLDARSLRKDYEDAKKGIPTRRNEKNSPPGVAIKPRTPDLVLLLAVAVHSELFGSLRKAIRLEELDDTRARELYIALEEGFRADESGVDALVSRLKDEQLKSIVLAATVSGEFDVNVERFVGEGIARIERQGLSLRREKIRERIFELGPDAEGLGELQYELMHLDAELAKMKGERDERS
jgi:DNA primase